jgi:hypothetical protein
MGTYFRLGPFVRIRHTRRGWRAGIGPRWFRQWFGTGGRGVSTGAGPFSYYQALPKAMKDRWRGTCPVCNSGPGYPCVYMSGQYPGHPMPNAHRSRRAG